MAEVSFIKKLSYEFGEVKATPESIPVVELLAASREIIKIFDVLGPTMFAPVKSDVNGNVEKLRKVLEKNTSLATLQAMLSDEKKNGSEKKDSSASVSGLWLKRALEFIARLLREVSCESVGLKECAQTAYGQTLQQYHGWVVKQMFKLAINALGTRQEFVLKLGPGDESTIVNDIKAFLPVFEGLLKTMADLYLKEGLDDPKKV